MINKLSACHTFAGFICHGWEDILFKLFVRFDRFLLFLHLIDSISNINDWYIVFNLNTKQFVRDPNFPLTFLKNCDYYFLCLMWQETNKTSFEKISIEFLVFMIFHIFLIKWLIKHVKLVKMIICSFALSPSDIHTSGKH